MEGKHNGANTQWKRGGSFRKLELEKFADENSEPESDGHYYYTPPTCKISTPNYYLHLFHVSILRYMDHNHLVLA